MGLIVFIFFFLVVLLMITINFVGKKEPFVRELAKIAITSLITCLFFFITIILLYNEVYNAAAITSKLFLIGMSAVSLYILNTTIKMPTFERKSRLTADIANLAVHIPLAFIPVFFVKGFTWNELSGFGFISHKLLNIPIVNIYGIIALIMIPVFSVGICIVKLVKEKNKIYKQQILIYMMSLIAAIGEWVLTHYTFSIFSWTVALMPAGYIILMSISTYAFSTTIVYDKKQIGFAILRFITFILLFSTISGFFASVILTKIRNLNLQIFLLIISAFFILIIRNIVSQKLSWFLGDTSEYKKVIEGELEKLDYAEGREELVKNFSAIIKNRLKTKGLHILVSDENNVLQTVHSSFEKTIAFPAQSQMFELLLEMNTSILIKSQVLASTELIDIKNDLIDLMDKISAEVLIIIREGQKVIGVMGIAEKLRKEEYTNYDYTVLSELYSYFFLIIYYLRNIAKQDLIFTVDREIEMSNQIIDSIQKNMDKVENKVIEINSVSYSAHQLGGDFIDFIKLSDDRYFFLIGDVAGKGLSASMSMVILKSMLHTYLAETPDFKELIIRLNSFIKENLPKGTFFAGLFGIIDFKTATIYYLNCGIPLMTMYIDSYKNVIDIQGEGRVLGFVKNIAPFLKVRKITMNRNDIIVFTTDGLLEAENLKGDRFGNERVGRIISNEKEKSPKDIADSIYKSLQNFILRDIEDDVTILVFKHI